MNDADLKSMLEQADEVYEGLIRTRASLGAMLAEAIRRDPDLSEFRHRVKDLPHLIRSADVRRTELRVELLSRRLEGAEAAHGRAAEDARRTLATLTKAKEAHAKAAGVERRSDLEAQRLRELRDEEALRLERLRADEPGPPSRAAPENAAEEPERAEPSPATGGAMAEGSESLWWRRVFGG